MSSFILKQYPILLRNMNVNSSFKTLQKLESRYEEGIDSYAGIVLPTHIRHT